MNFFQNPHLPTGYSALDLSANITIISRLQFELLSCQVQIQNLKAENQSLRAKLEQRVSSPCSALTSATHTEPNKGRKDSSKAIIQILSPEEDVIDLEPESASKSELFIPESEPSDSVFTSPTIELKEEDDDEFDEKEEVLHRAKLRRRYGFKADPQSSQEVKKKSKGNRSKAKHLWITYGRKIIDYALENSTGALKEMIEGCDKLTSKRGYTDVFLIKKQDSDKQKEEKRSFAKIALEFLDKEVENAFLSSNYREELVAQKESVRKWIIKLIK